jgi:DNA polymerase-1
MRDVEIDKIKEYAVEDADITLQLKNVFIDSLKEKTVEKVFYEVENPLVQVLKDMEYEGVRIDEGFLNEYSKELDKMAKAAEERVYAASGVRFNLSSPKQLGEVLFDKLKLDPKAKKTKTGQYATGEDVLQKLSHLHPVPADVLEYREMTKWRLVDALPQLTIRGQEECIHYGSAVAVTGDLRAIIDRKNIPFKGKGNTGFHSGIGYVLFKRIIRRSGKLLLPSAVIPICVKHSGWEKISILRQLPRCME